MGYLMQQLSELTERYNAWKLQNASDEKLQRWYEGAGYLFAQILTETNIGLPRGFHDALKMWEEREKEYANRGYRTVSLDDFLSPDNDISCLLGVKRSYGEEPIFHAKNFRMEHSPSVIDEK